MDNVVAQQGHGLGNKIGPLKVWQWAMIVAILGLGYWAYKKYVSGSSATATTPTDTTVQAADNEADYNALASGIVSLEHEDAKTTATPTDDTKAGKKEGSGYGQAFPDFTHLENGMGTRLERLGIPVYYEPSPGQLVKAPKSGLKSGTPLFALTSEVKKESPKSHKMAPHPSGGKPQPNKTKTKAPAHKVAAGSL